MEPHCCHCSPAANGETDRPELKLVPFVCRTDARKAASDDHIARAYDSSANGLLQHGHSPSYPLTRAENAVGCGRVVIALNASGARCA